MVGRKQDWRLVEFKKIEGKINIELEIIMCTVSM
jgi:hypothetical protein